MKVIINPPEDSWPDLLRRPQLELDYLESSVRNIFKRVKISGDLALREMTLQYDGAELDSLKVTQKEMDEGIRKLDPSIKKAIELAAANIRKFHELQKREFFKVETMPGVVCWRRTIPIQRIGIYVPGGSAPLFSTALMLGVPAQIAGCEQVILCTPPQKDGAINSGILYAAALTGVSNIFKVGGAQAIAAMGYGTSTIPAVHKIFGPGNQYVTKAKQIIYQEGIAIDMPAGPSEVMVIIDETSDESFAAADLLSQAEHGTDSQVVLISTSESKLLQVQAEIEKQLPSLPRHEIAAQVVHNSPFIYFPAIDSAIKFANEYAPEHLIINTKDNQAICKRIANAGSIFLGPYSPEAVGDYASGTNHALPTNGYAKAYSGVSLESFSKTITYQELTLDGLRALGPSVEVMAQAEGLEGHKRAVSVRLKKLK